MKIKNYFKNILIYFGYTGQNICFSSTMIFFVRTSDLGDSVY